MKAVAFKITITGKNEPTTVNYLLTQLGFPAEMKDGQATFYWAFDKGPIPNLCDCGLTHSAEIEAVYPELTEEEEVERIAQIADARASLLADLNRTSW